MCISDRNKAGCQSVNDLAFFANVTSLAQNSNSELLCGISPLLQYLLSNCIITFSIALEISTFPTLFVLWQNCYDRRAGGL